MYASPANEIGELADCRVLALQADQVDIGARRVDGDTERPRIGFAQLVGIGSHGGKVAIGMVASGKTGDQERPLAHHFQG